MNLIVMLISLSVHYGPATKLTPFYVWMDELTAKAVR
jgi:hypothetical protein